MRRSLLILVIISVLTVSCGDKRGYDVAILDSEDIFLMVGGEQKFLYKETTCQLVFNSSPIEFRAGTDTMSDYFRVFMSSVPSKKGQTLTGSVTWTSDSKETTLRNLSFKVLQVKDNGLVWLWDADQKVMAVIKPDL